MVLTIRTTHYPATELGFLLRKHPEKVQEFSLSFGKATVFYPEATEDACTVALVVEVDPVRLVRGSRQGGDGALGVEAYVNDRPYAACSFLSVAIAEVFGSAMSGKSPGYENLIETPIPLKAVIPVLPCRGGEALLRHLFEPLGYEVRLQRLPLDESFPEWGESRYYHVELEGTHPLQVFLSHLYVLVPVLDDEKHYWVGEDEVTKLLRHGEGWLKKHPEKDLIARRYLRHRRGLVNDALERLEDLSEEDPSDRVKLEQEPVGEREMSLSEKRIGSVLAVLKEAGVRRVLDLGCGEGKVLQAFWKEKQFTELVGMDVSFRALEVAMRRLRYDFVKQRSANRLTLFQGSLMYRDERLAGYDAAVLMEVIEHVELSRLWALEVVVFREARPGCVVITTPNQEYNVLWESLASGKKRHSDHRFEWTRSEFETWSQRVAGEHGYSVRFLSIGPEHPELGTPTQMGVFTRA